jgi:hypothetical protein
MELILKDRYGNISIVGIETLVSSLDDLNVEPTVGKTTIGPIHISTVFSMGFALGFINSTYYETMVFSNGDVFTRARYSTEAEALIGHIEICKEVLTNGTKNMHPEELHLSS